MLRSHCLVHAEQDELAREAEALRLRHAADTEAKAAELRALVAERDKQATQLSELQARYERNAADLAELQVRKMHAQGGCEAYSTLLVFPGRCRREG